MLKEGTIEYEERLRRIDRANVAIPWILCLSFVIFVFVDYSIVDKVDKYDKPTSDLDYGLLILAILGILFLFGYPIYAAYKWVKMSDKYNKIKSLFD